MINKILQNLKRKKILNEWKSHFPDSFIVPVNHIPFEKIKIGKYSYGPLQVEFWGGENEKLTIGSFVSIAADVKFILGGNHNYKKFSTYPFKVFFGGEKVETESKGEIVVGDGSWIGMSSIILSGVNIGKGVVIGAGSVVSNDIPDYAVVAGNPARVIKFRFSDDVIFKLKKLDYSLITPEFVQYNMDLLYSDMDNSIADKLLSFLKS